MAVDEFPYLRRGENVDGQLRSGTVVSSLHHTIEQRGQSFSDGLFIAHAPGRKSGRFGLKQLCIASVQPLVVRGAQSKKS